MRAFATDQERLEKLYLALIRKPVPGEGRYNVAPSEPAWIIRHDGRLSEVLEAAEADWWLTPYWSKTRVAKELRDVQRQVGDAGEIEHVPRTVPAQALPRADQRLLRVAEDRRGPPTLLHPTRERRLLLAGVWDRWRSTDRSEKVDSFAIVTTAAHPASSRSTVASR